MTSRPTIIPDSREEHLAPHVQEKLLRQGFDVRLPNQLHQIAKSTFQGPAPPGLMTLMLCQPSTEHKFAQLEPTDPATNRDLNRVRIENEVYIEFPEDSDGFIKISAHDRLSLQNGANAIRDLIYVNGQDLSSKTFPLIHREGVDTRILLKSIATVTVNGVETASGWRAIASPSGITTDTVKSSAFGLADLVDNGKEVAANKLSAANVLETLVRAAQAIRPAMGDLRMRIHLGHLAITEKKKNSPNKYSDPGFNAVLLDATSRGSTHFARSLGNEKLTEKILDNIYETWDAIDPIYIPEDPLVDTLRAVRRQYCLVFFSGNYRIEMDVQYHTNDASIPLTAGYPRVFHSFGKALQTEVVVACPDKKFDWQLCVESDIGAKEVAAEFIRLQRVVRFGPVPEKGFDFPIAQVPRQLLRDAKIDNVACKVYLTFSCASVPFNFEVAVYHDWLHIPEYAKEHRPRAPNTSFDTTGRGSPPPVKSCAVSFYGMSWDGALRELNVASRGFPMKFADVFSLYGVELEDSIACMMKEVDRLVDIATIEAGGSDEP